MSLCSMSSLWEEGWKDRRLGGGGQLEAMWSRAAAGGGLLIRLERC